MKQIGLGIMMYIQDYDETMPVGRAYGTYNTGLPLELGPYIGKVNGFAANTAGIWHCPDHSGVPFDPNAAGGAGALAPNLTTQSYLPVMWRNVNGGKLTWSTEPAAYTADRCLVPTDPNYLTGTACAENGQPGRIIAQFQDPAGTLLLVEEHSPSVILGENDLGIKRPYQDVTNGWALGSTYLAQNCISDVSTSVQNCTGVGPFAGGHTQGSLWNYLFCDGHVKAMASQNTLGNAKTTYGPGNPTPAGMWTVNPND